MKLIVACLLSGGLLLSLSLSAQSTLGARDIYVVLPGLTRDGVSTVLSPAAWGGSGVRLDINEAGSAAVEFDCAHGLVVGPLTIEPDGTFRWVGTYTRESGGPRTGEEPTFPATYAGSVSGAEMSLTVDIPQASAALSYTLTEGEFGRILKCL